MLTSGHQSWYVFDDTMKAYRSTLTGHRMGNFDGSPVRSTRVLAMRRPWLAAYELWARRSAKKFGRPS